MLRNLYSWFHRPISPAVPSTSRSNMNVSAYKRWHQGKTVKKIMNTNKIKTMKANSRILLKISYHLLCFRFNLLLFVELILRFPVDPELPQQKWETHSQMGQDLQKLTLLFKPNLQERFWKTLSVQVIESTFFKKLRKCLQYAIHFPITCS